LIFFTKNQGISEFIFKIAYIAGNFGFLWVLVFFNELDTFLKRTFLIIIPFYLSMLYVANIFEYRIFNEMIPLVLTPALYILVKKIKSSSVKNL